jgi:hypothetical protein
MVFKPIAIIEKPAVVVPITKKNYIYPTYH